MAICRTEGDNDIYAYPTSGGVEFHVATRRDKIGVDFNSEEFKTDMNNMNVEDFLEKYTEEIDVKYAGKSYFFRNTDKMRVVFNTLVEAGIRVPQKLMEYEIKEK